MKKPLIAFIFFSFFSVVSEASNQLIVFEDLLYWHASEQTASLWVTVQPLNNPPGFSYSVPGAQFGWSPGLRLGVQNEPTDYFMTKLYWTYFSTKTNDAITAPEGHVLFPEFFNGFQTLNLFNNARLNWKLTMNMIDAQIGHQFKPSESVLIRPFIGVKGGTINQRINSSWLLLVDGLSINTATEDLKNNFRGVGPSFGIDSVWGLYKNFNIRADAATALLWGAWNIQDIYNRPAALLVSPTTIRSDRNNALLGAYMAKLFVGVDWSFQAKALVVLKAGYEMEFWSNQLRLPLYEHLPVHGDLTLQGVTCGISIEL